MEFILKIIIGLFLLGFVIMIFGQVTSRKQKPVPQKPVSGAQGQQTAPVWTALDDLTPGQRNVRFGEYLWRVLDVQNNKALLLAEEIFEMRRYHSKYSKVTWETCELRGYLNGEFLETFSSQEQSRIVPTENTNADNPWYGTSGGKRTVDRVFLLSIDEVLKYFGDSGRLQEGPKKVPRAFQWINDEYNSARIAKYQGKKVLWWLRSPGYDAYHAVGVDVYGFLVLRGLDVNVWDDGVRPSLWINL